MAYADQVNAEIDGTDVVYKNFVHMSIAAGTPQGLVVRGRVGVARVAEDGQVEPRRRPPLHPPPPPGPTAA